MTGFICVPRNLLRDALSFCPLFGCLTHRKHSEQSAFFPSHYCAALRLDVRCEFRGVETYTFFLTSRYTSATAVYKSPF